MISEKMKPFMANNSAIRAMFEEGKRMAAIYGKENVYDFSLGNPNVPVPQVTEAILDVVKNEDFMTLHGYMSNAGFEDVRQTIADSLNKRFGTNFSFKNLIMTVGAASGLNIILKSILNPGDEVIVFAPYFVEYNAYVRNYDGNVVIISRIRRHLCRSLMSLRRRSLPERRLSSSTIRTTRQVLSMMRRRSKHWLRSWRRRRRSSAHRSY